MRPQPVVAYHKVSLREQRLQRSFYGLFLLALAAGFLGGAITCRAPYVWARVREQPWAGNAVIFSYVDTNIFGIFELAIGLQEWCSLIAAFLGAWILTELYLQDSDTFSLNARRARRYIVARIILFLLIALLPDWRWFEYYWEHYIPARGLVFYIGFILGLVGNLIAIALTLLAVKYMRPVISRMLCECSSERYVREFNFLTLGIIVAYLLFVFEHASGFTSIVERIPRLVDRYVRMRRASEWLAIATCLWFLAFSIRAGLNLRRFRRSVQEVSC